MKNEMITLLQPYFEKRDDIVMAFLFGSWAKGKGGMDSDVDIAVYFKPKTSRLEWEDSDARYDGETVLWREIEGLLGKEVDLLVLNRAASSVAESAISGAPLVIKDRGLYVDFMMRVTAEAEDFREFVISYWKLKEEIRTHAGE
ncbi:MAG: nucleotidyltransferase domain-containing protein [Deltaproteobacteria bacterium]|nr:nucleotidyltransferase domain-containing protein [Deltaproteobacteria bacterium]